MAKYENHKAKLDEGALNGCIDCWKSKKFHNQALIEPSLMVIMENTIAFLGELKQRRQEDNVPK